MKGVLKMDVFYKDEFHKEQTEILLNKFGMEDLFSNVEYGSFAYIVGATGKAKNIIKCFDETNSIHTNLFYETIQVYSSSEKDMLLFALQCFNGSLSEITLDDTFRSLDSNNEKTIKQAINIRY